MRRARSSTDSFHFVDLTQAFGMVNTDGLRKIMAKFTYVGAFINLSKLSGISVMAKWSVLGANSIKFLVDYDTEQSCILIPLLVMVTSLYK